MAFIAASKGASPVRLSSTAVAEGEPKRGYVLVFLRASEPGLEQVVLHIALTDGTVRQVPLAFQCG